MSRSRLIGVLAVVICLPAFAVAWLGFRLLAQDSAFERQRLIESRDMAADHAVQALSAILSDPKLFSVRPAEGAILARFPGSTLIYNESVPPLPEAPPDAFREGEALEFQGGNAAPPTEIYRRHASSPDSAIRAGALYRLGRTAAKAGRVQEALQAFSELSRMESSAAAGWPAPIAGIWSRCRIFSTTGQSQKLREEALKLREMLLSGRYPITRASYLAFAEDAARWSGTPRPAGLELLTDTVISVAAGVQKGALAPSGRALLSNTTEPVTAVWERGSESVAVFAARRAYVEREWLPRAGTGVWLRDNNGTIIGSVYSGEVSVRHSSDSRLPWSVVAVAPKKDQDFGSRRRLLIVMLSAVGFLTVAGAYIVFRALRRELVLARMQEDFVAAVSHEFRTPLTTLRQIIESLEDGRVTNEEKRMAYYHSLGRAAQRLHRLVEDLLDFRRMQSDALVYHRAPINVREFTGQLVSDFQREVGERGFEILAADGPDIDVVADPNALNRALWNLLDNAVKYSGKERRVELRTLCRDRVVEWSVRDFGDGIPAEEQPLVFQKFYRGYAARRGGIRGTGIGLSMVEQIVSAHGGRVTLDSELGEGSVFTISLPCGGEACIKS